MPFQTISGSTTTVATGVTTVDCQKQVRSWRLLKSLIELLIPTCNCTFIQDQEIKRPHKPPQNHNNYHHNSNNITGTIFGFRRGKVNLCIQTTSKSTNPLLLLEFALPTIVLAREMQSGVLRIALHCSGGLENSSTCLLSMPVWTMYCNGRKAGYAVKRRPSKIDLEALKLMNSVVVGAGVISGRKLDRDDDELIYLRACFDRVYGSSEAESFHLIDPDGSIGQELSIFFFRSS